MTLTEFMSILNGEYKETAGTTARNQCVDLANAYIKYVLGLPIIEWANAVDFPSKAGDNYKWIENTPDGVPKEGDLVIWGGTYGHIAIFIEGNNQRFTSFDENYPIGSPCHVQEHSYLSPKVLGWLHPKINPNSGNSTPTINVDEFNALKVLKSQFAKQNPGGNLEGWANTLTQDAYPYYLKRGSLEKQLEDSDDAFRKEQARAVRLQEQLTKCQQKPVDTSTSFSFINIIQYYLKGLFGK